MKAGTGRRKDQGTFQLSLNYSATSEKSSKCSTRNGEQAQRMAELNPRHTDTRSMGVFQRCRTREGRSDTSWGKSSACRGMGEQGGISYHLTEHPLPPFSYPVISANAVLNPAVAVSSGHYHPRSINEETRAEVTHSVSSGPSAPKPLPFLDQENRPD